MRNKPFSAISSQMVAWVDLILHNETVVITMDNCCTFRRSSIREISHIWPFFEVLQVIEDQKSEKLKKTKKSNHFKGVSKVWKVGHDVYDSFEEV